MDPLWQQRLSLKGDWVVSPALPTIGPMANACRFKVDDTDSNHVFYRVIPRGAPLFWGAAGWMIDSIDEVRGKA